MPDVVLIRPGCTDFDDQNRILGDLDLPMNVRGLGQVDELVDELRDKNFNVIYCDPTEPARSTAHSIGEKLGIRIKERDELRNVDHGLWQGLQQEDIKRKFPKAYKQWKDAPETICPPEGELFTEALERVRKVLKKPLKKEVPIAIVASEPLATLIECVVDGRTPTLLKTCANAESPRIQYLTINQYIADETTITELSAAGSQKNNAQKSEPPTSEPNNGSSNVTTTKANS